MLFATNTMMNNPYSAEYLVVNLINGKIMAICHGITMYMAHMHVYAIAFGNSLSL